MAGFAEYERYDGLGLAGLVRRGEVSARELVEAAASRIEARNPALDAVIHRMDEKARAAAAAPPEGPFQGVPFLVKDLVATVAGEPLTRGSRFAAGLVPDHDSELVHRFRRAGLLLLGKSNIPELGIMGWTESRLLGPARNPWSVTHTPGGSSGGAAAAVAAGMVPLAHGNDGGGSIRIPASCCGLFGLKPSRGRNPLGPDLSEGWGGLVVEHAITRTVRDSAALLDATRGPDAGAPYAAPAPERSFLEEVDREPGRLRVAFTTQSIYGRALHPDCRDAVLDAARLLEGLGHAVEEAHPDYDKPALRQSYLALVAASVHVEIQALARATGRRADPSGFEPETWLLGLIGSRLTAAEYVEAVAHGHAAARAFGRFHARYDLLLTATLAHPPARIGAFDATRAEAASMAALRRLPVKRLLDVALSQMAEQKLEATANTMLFNQTGQPAMSVPLFWSAAGLPIGVQLVAPYGDEATLFRVAAQLEQARPWFDRRPAGFGDGSAGGG